MVTLAEMTFVNVISMSFLEPSVIIAKMQSLLLFCFASLIICDVAVIVISVIS